MGRKKLLLRKTSSLSSDARKIAVVFHSRRASCEGLRTLASTRKSFSDMLENKTRAYCVSSIGVRVFIVNININFFHREM